MGIRRGVSMWLPGLAVFAVLLFFARPARARLRYPETPVRAVTDTLYGVPITDPYRWLEYGDSPEVQDWTSRQNAFTRAYLDAWQGRPRLRADLEKFFHATSVHGEQIVGRRYFYYRKEGAQNHAVLYLREGGPTAPARPVLDPNTFSQDGTVALDWMFPSPDGGLLLYGKSADGSENSTLHVRDVATGKDLSDVIPHVRGTGNAWDADGKGFYYTRHPAKGEVPAGEEVFHAKIYHHRLGEAPSQDALIFGGEGRPVQEWREADASSDHKWVFLSTSVDWAKNDLYILPGAAGGDLVPVAVGLDGIVNGDVYGDHLFLRTNAKAPRYHVVRTDIAHPGPETWKEIIPEQKGVIESMDIVGGKLVIRTLESAVSHLHIYSLDGRLETEVPLPTLGSVSGVAGRPDGSEFFFDFESFAFPSSVYRYDLIARKLERVEASMPDFDPSPYTSKQVWVTSKDGTRVPMFLVHRKDLKVDGRRPTLLSGYGGFEVSETPYFRGTAIPWMDRGGVYAVACLRGGGEFGRSWHEAGRLGNKQNVFDDFYACAQFLIDDRLTSPEMLVAEGGSNGGLLVGAALTQRPDLFKAILCQVPLLDMLRYQDFLIARYWVPEYGSSEDPGQFKWLRAYSPYQNVKSGTKYPATLFTAGESDSRVDPMHARKMTALVQAQSGGDAPILVRIESKAGHGQGKPTSKKVDEATDLFGFLMMQVGME